MNWKRNFVGILISFFLILSLYNISNANLTDGLVDYYPFNGNANSEYTMEMTISVKNSSGEVFKVSRAVPINGDHLLANNGNSFITPVYWGEESLNLLKNKAVDSINDLKSWIMQLIQTILVLMLKIATAIGVVLILVATAVMTYFVNVSFPIIPKNATFYFLFFASCGIWFFLIPSLYISIIYASSILLLPFTVGLAYKKLCHQ